MLPNIPSVTQTAKTLSQSRLPPGAGFLVNIDMKKNHREVLFALCTVAGTTSNLLLTTPRILCFQGGSWAPSC